MSHQDAASITGTTSVPFTAARRLVTDTHPCTVTTAVTASDAYFAWTERPLPTPAIMAGVPHPAPALPAAHELCVGGIPSHGKRTAPQNNPGAGSVLGTSTSRPGTSKAHGTAGDTRQLFWREPRLAGLFQNLRNSCRLSPIAVLEQPSPGRMTDQTLERRHIVLPQRGEFNTTPRTACECSQAGAIVNALPATTKPGRQLPNLGHRE